MQNMFRERLIAILPEPQLELDLEIIDLFESLNYTAPLEVLQEIMEVSTSNIDTAQYLMRIDSTFNGALDDLLLAFGVEVTESTPLAYKHDLARGITQLPFYYLPIEVLNILDGTFQNDVILAELIQLTRSVSVEESLEYIKTVNDGLITTIGEEMRKLNAFQDAVSDTVAIKLDRSRVSNINRLLRDPRASVNLTCLRSLAGAGARMGADYQSLINQFAEELTLKQADHMTIELLGLALFSDLPAEKWIEATQQAATEFTDLLSDHRKIDIALNDFRLFFEM